MSREAHLVDLAAGLRVLHLGCAGDRLLQGGETTLHEKLAHSASELWGVDLNAGAISELGTRLPAEAQSRLIVANACALARDAFPLRFDLVIAGDLIEHVVEPAELMSSVKPHLAPGGTLVLTTPNATGLLQVMRCWRGRESVSPHHVLWFSASTLARFAQLTGWRLERLWTGYDWEPAGRATRLKYAVGSGFFRRFPLWGGTLIAALRPLAPVDTAKGDDSDQP